MTPVIIQSNILLPTKPCASSTTLLLSFLDDDDVCPNSGSRDDDEDDGGVEEGTVLSPVSSGLSHSTTLLSGNLVET